MKKNCLHPEDCNHINNTSSLSALKTPCSLKNCPMNAKVTIKSLQYNDKVKIKLHAMGLAEGECIKRVYKSPFGTPAIYEVCGYQLTLRDNIAANIIVQ